MEENHIASFGGLLRRSMWRWREGMALKKEQPGINSVWIIIGLEDMRISRHAIVGDGGQREEEDIHGEVVTELHDPDGTTCYLDDGEEEDEAHDYGTVDCPARGFLPFSIALPGEVVVGECAWHFRMGLRTGFGRRGRAVVVA